MPDEPLIIERWNRDTILGDVRAKRQRLAKHPFQININTLAARFATAIAEDMPDLDPEVAGELVLMMSSKLGGLLHYGMDRLDVAVNLLACAGDDLIAGRVDRG